MTDIKKRVKFKNFCAGVPSVSPNLFSLIRKTQLKAVLFRLPSSNLPITAAQMEIVQLFLS